MQAALRRTKRKRSAKASGRRTSQLAAIAPVGGADASQAGIAAPEAPVSETTTFGPAPGDGVEPCVPAQPPKGETAPEKF